MAHKHGNNKNTYVHRNQYSFEFAYIFARNYLAVNSKQAGKLQFVMTPK